MTLGQAIEIVRQQYPDRPMAEIVHHINAAIQILDKTIGERKLVSRNTATSQTSTRYYSLRSGFVDENDKPVVVQDIARVWLDKKLVRQYGDTPPGKGDE